MKIPLRQDELIVIQASPDGYDPQALQAALDPLGLIVCLVGRSSLAEAEMKRLLSERGVTYVWRLVRLQEAVVPQTKHVEPLVRVLESMLAKLAPSQDFVIVDRYLFPKGSELASLYYSGWAFLMSVRCFPVHLRSSEWIA